MRIGASRGSLFQTEPVIERLIFAGSRLHPHDEPRQPPMADHRGSNSINREVIRLIDKEV
jgi:hypothetical protein